MPAIRACCSGGERSGLSGRGVDAVASPDPLRQSAPLPAAAAAAGLRQRAGLTVSAAGLFWLDFNPDTGDTELWQYAGKGPRRLSASGTSIRSAVNGYGGGAACAMADGVLVVEATSQQILRIDSASGQTRPMTACAGACFGGLVADPVRQRALAVRETADGQQLVAVDGSGAVTVLHQGLDFYSAPAVSDSGRRLAWVSWRLPDMPWVASQVWVADLDDRGRLAQVRSCVAPGPAAVQQPVFNGEQLVVLADHLGWWQPFAVTHSADSSAWQALPCPALDHASAPWQLAESHSQPLPGGGWARVCYREGRGELWLWPADGGQAVRLAPEYGDFRSLQCYGDGLYCIARSASRLDAVLRLTPSTGELAVLAGGERPLAGRSIVPPEPFVVPPAPAQPLAVHGFLYRPWQSGATAPPPLILLAHGGPTSAVYPVFNPQIQFWCSHGFAVAEVNYRGSTGFGRDFRMALAEQWGDAEVEDMGRALEYLASAGLGDRRRSFIQGRSSGGYTALMAMVRGLGFRAGASLFGVSDPRRLRAQTHRFESGYLDWLLGDPVQQAARWQQRTPALHASRIGQPMIFFQGEQDKVVVPEQTRSMAAAMAEAGNPPEVHWFASEGHGFRQPETQAAMMEALLAFYQRQSHLADAAAGNLR